MIHVLGSDIAHHNPTVLRFFNDVLAAELPGRPLFWVVSAAPERLGTHPRLDVVAYPDRRALARALVARARRARGERFFLHGQFSPWIWLALLTGAVHGSQVLWHIWGADLYENVSGPRAWLAYSLRRAAHGRVGQVFGTRGDLAHYRRGHPGTPSQPLYFPTRMPDGDIRPAPAPSGRDPLTVVIGNSGDRGNRHVEALHAVRERFGPDTRVVIPFGYPPGNDGYARRVRAAAHRLFAPERVELLEETQDLDRYAATLARCDLGYFIFRRQQGIGTLCLLIRSHVPFVISPDNPFALDLAGQRIPFLLHGGDLDARAVARTRAGLAALSWDDISFAPHNCVAGWRRALTRGQTDAPR
ncbi:TDP-N-acetylfucosamine:lipid II N-acetylfucosaminyltransferase [Streptosporangium sp. NPDC002524]|uniref:TDP-N-acetylfucosamine:lipid II N-acetylfucosaminyltransferase n=1 Tax=Streptosporangium sp. NPDC002524 TaxID=3154537 RepID=UPI0033241D43